MNNPPQISELVEEATLSFALGDASAALKQLYEAAERYPGVFAVHHALAEIHFSERQFEQALKHAETAAGIDPGDIHIHTTLSRVWMELGDKEKAESYGARGRLLGWKEQLKSPPDDAGFSVD